MATVTRKSGRIPAAKLKQAQKEEVKESARLQLSKASKDKITNTKERKDFLEQITSLSQESLDPVIGNKVKSLLKLALHHGSDKILEAAIEKMDFYPSLPPSPTTRKRKHDAADPKVTAIEKPSKRARLLKKDVSNTSDRFSAASRARPQAKVTKTTSSTKVTTAKAVKRKAEEISELRPSKKNKTTKPAPPKKATKAKARPVTRIKLTMETAAKKRAQQASLLAEKGQVEVQTGAGVAASAEFEGEEQVNAISSAQVEIIGRDEAQDNSQVEAQLSDARHVDTATKSTQTSPAPALAQPSTSANPVPLKWEWRIGTLTSYGIVMRRPGATHGENLDLSDPFHRSLMDRHLSERNHALDDRLCALLNAPRNEDAAANNWIIDLEDCIYAYESAGDVQGAHLRNPNIMVQEPREYKDYFRMTCLWKNMRKAGIGLWEGPDEHRGLFVCLGAGDPQDVITMLGRQHAGDLSKNGLQARLVRLRASLQTLQPGHCSIDPLDGSKIEYGGNHWAYDYEKNPEMFEWAAWEGDPEHF